MTQTRFMPAADVVLPEPLSASSPSPTSQTDADIADAARVRLSWAVDVPSELVRVSVRDHVITLSGHVRWAFQSEAAMRTVAHIDGAWGVRNTITLTVTPTRSA